MNRRIRFCSLVVAAALLSAGCGANAEDDTPADGASTSAAQASARDVVDTYTTPAAPIELPALTKPAPSDITIAVMSCPLPVCKTATDGAVDGAKALGWTVKEFTNPFTPEGYAAAWTSMLQADPDVIAYVATLPNSVISTQLEQAQSRGIPMVGIGTAPTDLPNKNGPMLAAYTGEPSFEQAGRLMGNVVVADGGAAKTVFVWDPNLTVWTPTKDAFEKVLSGAGGSADVLEVPFSEIGKDAPQQIVSYVQAHPDVEYVVLAVDDYATGLPEALKAAGLDGKVKIVGRAPQAANLAYLKSGQQFASVADENSAGGWRAVDGLARILVGDDISDCCFDPAGLAQILTTENTQDLDTIPDTPGEPSSFLAAWGV